MRDIRIVFMGTPEFAVGILKALIAHGCSIVGVVTAPDKPAGRGRKMNESAVKTYALANNLTVLQPTNLKQKRFLESLRALKATLQVVVAFRMLPKAVWQMPKYGTFNLHASLLPQYRGAAPINWALINGEKKTGVTTFFIDQAIDTGAIILQRETPIFNWDNAGSLHDRLMLLGAEAVLQTVEKIKNNTAEPILQEDDGNLKSAPKIHKDTCKIDWNGPLDHIHNFIRGLSPYPTAWAILHTGETQMVTKIYAAEPEHTENLEKPGTVVISHKKMKVAVKDGYLHLKELQLQGKRKMPVTDVLNGLHLEKNAFMA